jgi:hypothetical protein
MLELFVQVLFTFIFLPLFAVEKPTLRKIEDMKRRKADNLQMWTKGKG